MPTLRELSKTDFDSTGNSTENINIGSLQRIADATELMAKNYLNMEHDLKYYKNRCAELVEARDKRDRQIAALKGVITKQKNMIASLKAANSTEV